jgi:Cu+-exporting ATPase
MDLSQIVVTISGAVLIAAVLLFFFGPRRRVVASDPAGIQEVHIIVKGGYSPNLVSARRGRPLRLIFDRQETNPCSDTVVFPDLAIRRALPAFQQTSVEFVPETAGEFAFTCGMSMLRGTLIITDV